MAEAIVKGKKKFYQIIAPELFNKQEIGEVPLYEINDALGRTIEVNLLALTNDPKRQNTNIHFRISGNDGQRLMTEVTGYKIAANSVRRMMKRKKIRIDDSIVVKTNDNRAVRIKPFLITAGFARSAALRGLSKNLRDVLTKNAAKLSYDSLIKDIISRKFQSELREQLKKIYPLAVCEIRSMEIEKEKKGLMEQKKKKKERRGEHKEVKETEEKKVKEEKEDKKESKENAEEKKEQ